MRSSSRIAASRYSPGTNWARRNVPSARIEPVLNSTADNPKLRHPEGVAGNAITSQQVRLALATASLQLAEGDEDRAASTLTSAIEAHGLDKGIDRRGWRQLMALTYVLVPETRRYWDEQDFRGYLRTTRRLAVAVVAGRTRQHGQGLRNLDLPNAGIVRSALPVRFAAELAVGMTACGREEGALLLDALGPAGREAVRSFTTLPGTLAKRARSVLSTFPSSPPDTTYVAVLGPFAVRHDNGPGREDHRGAIRRRRVQELLAFLISHRHTTRAAISDELWPELDEDMAANNLAVTLNHLLRALEPWRRAGEAPYLIRLNGSKVRLVTGGHLRLDIDDFDDHVQAAARAEADGSPSAALEHHLAASEVYRGDLYSDLPDAAWIVLDREHYRMRFVMAATRAAQLCIGQGKTEHAEQLAHRALGVDPWAEAAHGVLIATALATGHGSSARRCLERCLDSLEELGVKPSRTTQQLQHRVQRFAART